MEKAKRSLGDRPRPRITVLEQATDADDAAQVKAGLLSQPKTIPSRYFYDAAGSELFEQICELPEYYPTRTEGGLLELHGPEIAALAPTRTLVELGSGSARKIRLLVRAFAGSGRNTRYVPIDVSAAAIEGSAADLLTEFPFLEVDGFVGTYERALARISQPNTDREPILVLFLGSTIGNFGKVETRQFLASLRAALIPGDFLLIGTDLRKDVEVIEAAYNDSRGITAAFNRNILRHLNRAFDGNFVPERFDHCAFYNSDAQQIEMHLRSRIGHSVRLAALDLDVGFRAGEAVRTEISRKFDADEFGVLLGAEGFPVVKRWTDQRRWFALSLARAR